MLSKSAMDAGWQTICCADASQALAAWKRTPLGLALVDLAARRGNTTGFRDVCATLSSTPSPLLCVCGSEDDAEEEVWARQLGAWLYLPGVTNSAELALLCEQALQIARKPCAGIRHGKEAISVHAKSLIAPRSRRLDRRSDQRHS
jgi:DNA-binding response OmpR family regulator